VALYKKWCIASEENNQRKCYWTFLEKDGGREEIRDALAEIIRSHYERLERIAEDVARLGFETAAEILRAELPQTAKARSSDLGEILATELVEEEIGLRVPVRRLRYKDGRSSHPSGECRSTRVVRDRVKHLRHQPRLRQDPAPALPR
jgi:hypothetical protein